MSERGIPFHCPYCGETDLWPHEIVEPSVNGQPGEVTSPHGGWECRGCLRAFSLKMLGLVRPGATPQGAPR